MTEASSLPAECLVDIFSFLSETDLYQVMLVSHRWNTIANDDSIWRELIGQVSRSFHQKYRVMLSADLPFPLNECKKIYQYLYNLASPEKQCNITETALSASSVDDPNRQSPKETVQDSSSFWSSTGSDSTEANEFITFKLTQPLCIVNYIDISPFEAYFQAGSPCYAPQQVQLCIGYSATSEDYSYVSPPYDIINKDEIQRFTIEKAFVAGGYVTIRLLGKCRRQPGDELFYSVLRYVRIWGIPLGFIGLPSLRSSLIEYASWNELFLKDLELRYSTDPVLLRNGDPFVACLQSGEITNPSDLCCQVLDLLVNQCRDQADEGEKRRRVDQLVDTAIASQQWNELAFLVIKENTPYLRGCEMTERLRSRDRVEIQAYLATILGKCAWSEAETILAIEICPSFTDTSQLTNQLIFYGLVTRRLHTSTRVAEVSKEKMGIPFTVQVLIVGEYYDSALVMSIEGGLFRKVFALDFVWRDSERSILRVLSLVKENWTPILTLQFMWQLNEVAERFGGDRVMNPIKQYLSSICGEPISEDITVRNQLGRLLRETIAQMTGNESDVCFPPEQIEDLRVLR